MMKRCSNPNCDLMFIFSNEKTICPFCHSPLVDNANNGSNNSIRMLLEYIIINTEKVLRDHLGMNYNFKFDESKLYELFPVKLFRDNIREYVIEYAIIKAAENM